MNTAADSASVAAYRTVILLEVLSAEPIDDLNLTEIAHAIDDGDCSSLILSNNSVAIDRATAEHLLKEQGSDPQFLFGDDTEEATTQSTPKPQWSITNPVPDYGDECVVRLANGGQLRCPTYPKECDYVRVVGADGSEQGYWNTDELSEAPAEVLGAILGAANASAD